MMKDLIEKAREELIRTIPFPSNEPQIAEFAAAVAAQLHDLQAECIKQELRGDKWAGGFCYTAKLFGVEPTQKAVEDAIRALQAENEELKKRLGIAVEPIDLIIHCPKCGTQHIDEPDPTNCMNCGHAEGLHAKSDERPRCYGDDAKGIDTPSCECKNFNPWTNPPHKKHRCLSCNHVFKVANVPTNGVETLSAVKEVE